MERFWWRKKRQFAKPLRSSVLNLVVNCFALVEMTHIRGRYTYFFHAGICIRYLEGVEKYSHFN